MHHLSPSPTLNQLLSVPSSVPFPPVLEGYAPSVGDDGLLLQQGCVAHGHDVGVCEAHDLTQTPMTTNRL